MSDAAAAAGAYVVGRANPNQGLDSTTVGLVGCKVIFWRDDRRAAEHVDQPDAVELHLGDEEVVTG